MSEKKIKLLVVDDMEGIREGVRFYFEDKGYSVFTAESAELASPIIKTETPDIILLDLDLPGMSGLDLLKLIRQFNNTVKVIMVSASNVNFLKDPRFRGLGISEFIPKPFSFDELELAIKKSLELPNK